METQKKARWYGPKQLWIMLYTAIIMLIGTCIIGGNNNTVFPAIAGEHGWNLNMLNIVSGISCMVKGFGILIFSRIVAKFGPKSIMVITLLITAGLVVVFGSTDNFAIMLFVILVLGLLGGAYEKNGGMKITANWWPSKKGVVLGFTTMGIVCMNFVYVPMMPKLFAKIGISNAFIIVAVIIAVVALLGLLFVKNTPEEAGTYPDGDPQFGGEQGAEVGRLMKSYKSPFNFKKLSSDPNTWTMGIGSGLAFLAIMSFIASLIPNLLHYGYALDASLSVFAVGGIVAIIGSFLFGVIDQKLGTKKAFIGYFICIIIGFAFTLFMSKNFVFVWVAATILFAAQGALCNLLP